MVNALDTIALTYAIVACLFLDTLAVVLVVFRKHRGIFPHQPWFLTTMAVSATCHIVAEAVTNNHAGFLVVLERSACAFFGYWLAYFFGAGFFFCALYMRLMIYATAISRRVSQLGAQRTRRLRWIICSLILLPVAVVASLATAESASVSDCASSRVLKILVGIWLSALIGMLVLSACLLRRGIVRDVASEIQKQAFVAGTGFVVLGALVFTMIISEDGLGDAINRFISTVAVTTFYLYTLGVLACAPLFRSYFSKGYASLVEEQFSSLTQPTDSVLVVLACAGFSAPDKRLAYYQRYPLREDTTSAVEAVSALFADFLLFCALDDQKWMNRTGGTEDPAVLCVAFAKFDHWTQRRKAKHNADTDTDTNDEAYCLDHDDDDDDIHTFPPLVSSALAHSTTELIARYFAKPGTPGFIDLGLSNHTRDGVTAAVARAEDGAPDTLFREAMWEIVGLLDRYYGHTYLTSEILRRDIFVSVAEPTVRKLLNDVQRCEAQRRLHEANLARYRDGESDTSVAVAVELS